MTSMRALVILAAALMAGGCATRGASGKSCDELAAQQARLADELRAEQARQAAELREQRAELLTLRRIVADGAVPAVGEFPEGEPDEPDVGNEVAPEADPLEVAPKPPRAQLPAEVRAVPVGGSPVDGPADAWVTIVEFTDFQCPFCGRVQATLEQLRERYGKDVRFVVKHNPLPFHPNARPAAIAAECARAQGRFWPYAKLLFARQRELGADAFRAMAREVGIDAGKFEKCLVRTEAETRIARDQALATALGANGTPTFFVNGRILVGAQPLAAFATLVDEELAKAKASGLPAKEYYRRAVEQAKGR